MELRSIGSLSVSAVGLGCNQLATAACPSPTAERVVGEALEAGITFFDTSDEYGRDYLDVASDAGWGASEEVLGRALQAHRDQVTIATKFGPPGPLDSPNLGEWKWLPRSEAGARGIRLAVEESLRRLQTDRIDLYQLHFPDFRFGLDETLGTLDDLVRAGKVREIGSANFDGALLKEADATARAGGHRPFASSQNELNILRRAALDAVLPACEELGLSFIPYFPLASGILTGKYRRGEPPPAGSRMADQLDDATRRRLLTERQFNRVEALEAYAADHGRSLIELAFAWLLGRPAVATVIAGASKPGQPAANAQASTWRLSAAEIAEVATLVAAAG